MFNKTCIAFEYHLQLREVSAGVCERVGHATHREQEREAARECHRKPQIQRVHPDGARLHTERLALYS